MRKTCLRCKKKIDKPKGNKSYCSESCRSLSSGDRRRWRKRGGPPTAKLTREEKLRNDRASRKRYRQRKKAEFIERYGNRCACCGDPRVELLTLDHVLNDGHKKRKNNASGPRTNRDNLGAYLDALRDYRPHYYQVLCMNCNAGKAWYGECPCKNYQRLSEIVVRSLNTVSVSSPLRIVLAWSKRSLTSATMQSKTTPV